MQPDSLSNKFGEEIGKWMKLLTDIKKSRATFDTSETKKEFGPGIVVFLACLVSGNYIWFDWEIFVVSVK